jgi:hypothetical protein
MKISLLAAAPVALLVTASPALADRLPTEGERAVVERTLRAAGFVSWEEIELDDDGPRWEVDDARASDGRRFDVKIDPKSLRIVRQERDR